MESHPPLFSSQANLIGLTPNDHRSGYSVDSVIENYEHDFDQLMLFEGVGFGQCERLYSASEANNLCLHSDAVPKSPDFTLSIEDFFPGSGNNDDGDSSAVTTRTRRDRAKTLVAERRRRARLKEKLYELRSLVPNITKMDKASIIADTLVYVKKLQSQAKSLEEEIDMHESTFNEDRILQISPEKITKFMPVEENSSLMKGKILYLNAMEVGEGKFHVTVECSKESAVTSCLFSAIESLTALHLESSTFTQTSEKLHLALIINARGFGEMNASTINSWVMGALLKEGYEL